MKIDRQFTRKGADAYADIAFRSATSEIRNPDGTVVFKLENCEIALIYTMHPRVRTIPSGSSFRRALMRRYSNWLLIRIEMMRLGLMIMAVAAPPKTLSKNTASLFYHSII